MCGEGSPEGTSEDAFLHLGGFLFCPVCISVCYQYVYQCVISMYISVLSVCTSVCYQYVHQCVISMYISVL